MVPGCIMFLVANPNLPVATFDNPELLWVCGAFKSIASHMDLDREVTERLSSHIQLPMCRMRNSPGAFIVARASGVTESTSNL